jgi:hypothetical protein
MLTASEIARIRSDTGSLLERTAHLFTGARATLPDASPAIVPGGSDVPEQTPVAAPLPPVGHETTGAPPAPYALLAAALDPTRPNPATGSTTAGPEPWASEPEVAESAGAALDRLVDAVVERIEHRVIDELQRRGRDEWRVV